MAHLLLDTLRLYCLMFSLPFKTHIITLSRLFVVMVHWNWCTRTTQSWLKAMHTRSPVPSWTEWQGETFQYRHYVLFISTIKCTSIMKGMGRWKGGDRMGYFNTLTYLEKDGATMVQLNTEEASLTLSASGSVK